MPPKAKARAPLASQGSFTAEESVVASAPDASSGESGRGSGSKVLADVAPYVAEFLGTFMLVFTVGYVSFYHNTLLGCTAIGFVLMVLVYSLGPVSGAHLNPAVTITLLLLEKIPSVFHKVVGYILCQAGGGLLAGGVVHWMFWETLPFGPAEPYRLWQAGLVEVIYTAMLCFVVANVAASVGNNPVGDGNCFFGLAIGFVVIAGAYGGGSISGGCFNPAVSLGMNIPFKQDLEALWYILFQVGGALIAVILYKVCREQEKDEAGRDPGEPELRTQAVCEFLGTFMLVFTVGLNVFTGSAAGAWSISAALMCMIYALGDVSGGQFNPAVTIAILLAGKDKDSIHKPSVAQRKACVYIAMQLLGGIAAAMVYESMHCSVHHTKVLGTGPGSQYTWQQAAIAEGFFTMLLALVVLSVAVYTPKEDMEIDEITLAEQTFTEGCEVTVDIPGAVSSRKRVEKTPWITKHRNHAALAIGLCIMAGGGAIGNVSGGHLNPAVSVGISTGQAIVCRDAGAMQWGNCLLYTLFQLGGAAFASLIYFATHPDDFKNLQ